MNINPLNYRSSAVPERPPNDDHTHGRDTVELPHNNNNQLYVCNQLLCRETTTLGSE